MMCAHPFMRDPSGSVRWSVKMTEKERLDCTPFPCGRCLPCKINNRRVWSHRLLLEQSVSESSFFVTLTYDPDHLPDPPVLKKSHSQKFIKRLRYYVGKIFKDISFRYFAVGEYGDSTSRPHFHYAFFLGASCSFELLSSLVSKSWVKGFSYVGDLNDKSATYIVGYVIKKMTKLGDSRLQGLTPEFMTSSRRPGIGAPAIDRVIRRFSGLNFDFDSVIRSFQITKKQMPLGRYLTRRLCFGLGFTQKQFDYEFLSYQMQFFDSSSPNFYHDIVDSSSSERLSQELKFNIFNSKRSL